MYVNMEQCINNGFCPFYVFFTCHYCKVTFRCFTPKIYFTNVMIIRVNCSIHSPFSDMTPIGFKFQLVIFMVLSAYSLCYQIDYFFETIKQKRDGISSIYNNSFRSTKTNKTILLLMWNSSKGIIYIKKKRESSWIIIFNADKDCSRLIVYIDYYFSQIFTPSIYITIYIRYFNYFSNHTLLV